ncbi:MAG: plasmid partitioning protein RepB [Pseudorhizobium sp.]
MARKNVFGVDVEPVAKQEATAHALAPLRPLTSLERPLKRAGPVGALSSSLGGMSEKANRADELERQLALGQAIVELEPELIDSSIVVDRLAIVPADLSVLAEQIRDNGQQVPILVRPHPQETGRYQVAYGHRRLAAVRLLDRKVRAVVRDLSDEQLVVSQGQENNARTDLSFIERSYFAFRLEQRGFGREIIMSAIGVDKAALSRMISLVESLPAPLIEFIGAAPSYGRTRWAELAELLQDPGKKAKALDTVATSSFADLASDDRFQAVYDLIRHMKSKPRSQIWQTADGAKAVRITETEDKLNLAFNKMVAVNFGAFVEARLEALYQEYSQATHPRTSSKG